MKPFCFSLFIDSADVHLTDEETIWYHDKEKQIKSSYDLNDSIEKLSKAKVVAIQQHELLKWKPKLLFLSQTIQPHAFVFGGTDISFTEEDFYELLEAFPSTRFFVTNFIGNHPRCHILPLGNVFSNMFNEAKTIMLSITYSRPNSQDRLEFYEFLQNNSQFQAFCAPELPLEEYNLLLARSFFSVCCCGNGYDTYRFWESLSQKAIPIVKNNRFFETLKLQYPQLPFVSIDDWKDLEFLLHILTPEYYENKMKTADFSVVFEPYWKSMLSEPVNIP